MMGRRDKAGGGAEGDCVGSPGNRWRDYMPKNHGKWKKVKRRLNRRSRMEAKRAIYRYDELLGVYGGSTAAPTDATAAPTDATAAGGTEEAGPEKMEGHEG